MATNYSASEKQLGFTITPDGKGVVSPVVDGDKFVIPIARYKRHQAGVREDSLVIDLTQTDLWKGIVNGTIVINNNTTIKVDGNKFIFILKNEDGTTVEVPLDLEDTDIGKWAKKHQTEIVASEQGVHGFRYFKGVFSWYNSIEDRWVPIVTCECEHPPQPVPVLGPLVSKLIDSTGSYHNVNWQDPLDNAPTTWVKTYLIYNDDHMPINFSDGTLVATSTVRDEFANGKTYYMSKIPAKTQYLKWFSEDSNGNIISYLQDQYTAASTLIAVDKPSFIDDNFIYDGTLKTVRFDIAPVKGITYDNTYLTGKNRNKYSTKFSLENGYIWSDGTTDDLILSWELHGAVINIDVPAEIIFNSIGGTKEMKITTDLPANFIPSDAPTYPTYTFGSNLYSEVLKTIERNNLHQELYLIFSQSVWDDAALDNNINFNFGWSDSNNVQYGAKIIKFTPAKQKTYTVDFQIDNRGTIVYSDDAADWNNTMGAQPGYLNYEAFDSPHTEKWINETFIGEFHPYAQSPTTGIISPIRKNDFSKQYNGVTANGFDKFIRLPVFGFRIEIPAEKVENRRVKVKLSITNKPNVAGYKYIGRSKNTTEIPGPTATDYALNVFIGAYPALMSDVRNQIVSCVFENNSSVFGSVASNKLNNTAAEFQTWINNKPKLSSMPAGHDFYMQNYYTRIALESVFLLMYGDPNANRVLNPRKGHGEFFPGRLDQKGMFYKSSDGIEECKFLGLEAFFGHNEMSGNCEVLTKYGVSSTRTLRIGQYYKGNGINPNNNANTYINRSIAGNSYGYIDNLDDHTAIFARLCLLAVSLVSSPPYPIGFQNFYNAYEAGSCVVTNTGFYNDDPNSWMIPGAGGDSIDIRRATTFTRLCVIGD